MRKTLALLSGLMLVASFAAYGDTYNEAPMLAALVSAGSLPPVDDRLPDVPQVVEPQASLGQSIGEYGGTANVLHLRPDLTRDGWYLAGTDPFLRIDFDQSTIVTNMPERYELSGDGMTFTFKLRAGMKWSDGEPFGLHDIEFWHTDILQNESLTPSVPGGFAPGGEVMRYEAVDETTARLHFSAPHPLFTTLLVGGWGGVLTPPSHYLKQFHIAHNSDADKVAKEAGFDAWHQYFNDRNRHFIGFPMKPDLPTLNPYTQTRKETDLLVYERNPFYWKVDSEGNQLPYIDRIVSRRLEELQVYYGKIISGEADFAAAEGHTVNFQEFPMFKENEAAGQYRVLLWQYTNQSSPTLMLNQTLEGDDVLRDLFREVNFRRALSLAIDRHEINEVLYFGRAKPTQINALSTSKYYNPDYDDSWAQFDPDRANQMLDELGLEWDRNREFRLRSDGKRLAWTFLTADHSAGARGADQGVLGRHRGGPVDQRAEHRAVSRAGACQRPADGRLGARRVLGLPDLQRSLQPGSHAEHRQRVEPVVGQVAGLRRRSGRGAARGRGADVRQLAAAPGHGRRSGGRPSRQGDPDLGVGEPAGDRHGRLLPDRVHHQGQPDERAGDLPVRLGHAVHVPGPSRVVLPAAAAAAAPDVTTRTVGAGVVRVPAPRSRAGGGSR